MTEEQFIKSIIGSITPKGETQQLREEWEEKVSRRRLNKILDKAYSIRDFELDMYWKRATYFWAFILVAFTAYGYFKIEHTSTNTNLEFLIICIGFVFSLAWYLVNRGSTYWTTHWERIIDTIEKRLGINLYAINLTAPKTALKIGSYYPYSVSRINIIVSFSICVVWLCMMLDFLGLGFSICDNKISFEVIFTLIGTIIVSAWMLFGTKSKKKSTYSFYEREITYKNQ